MPNYCEWCITVLGDKESLEAIENQVRCNNLIVRPKGNTEGSLDVWADWQVGDKRSGWCDREDHGINPAYGPNIRDRFESQSGLRLCGVGAWSPPSDLLNVLIRQSPQCDFVMSYSDQTNNTFLSWRVKDDSHYCIDGFSDYGEMDDEPIDYIVAGKPVGAEKWNDGHWSDVEFWLGVGAADHIYASLHGTEAAKLWRESRTLGSKPSDDRASSPQGDKPATTDEAFIASLGKLSSGS